MKLTVIIPAQEINRYHKSGDLAPFGDTTLLEWKISQCKKCIDPSNIYILTSSNMIRDIAQKENIQIIKRDDSDDYKTVIMKSLGKINTENIMVCNVTTPFMNPSDYKIMIKQFLTRDKEDSLVAIVKKQEYSFLERKKINFVTNFTPREKLNPVALVNNGIYLFTKDSLVKTGSMIGDNPLFYELDDFSSIEIKDILTYQMSNNLIAFYIQKDLNV